MRSLGMLAATTLALTSLGGSPFGFKRGPTPNRYTPHIGAKQRGKYPPNMPLHVSAGVRAP